MTSPSAPAPLLRSLPLLGALLALGILLTPPAAAREGWTTISYLELVDPAAVIRTGQNLRTAMAARVPRGALQPHLDPFSSLLPAAVLMLFGEDPDPQEEISRRRPPGTPQPAWVPLCRSGRIVVTSDGKRRARVFLPGDDPRTAYQESYPVLRHPLGDLAAAAPGPLEVEVFAYRNDYHAGELSLRLSPYTIRRSAFPPYKTSLDLESLERFFKEGGKLEGAELSREEGLVLYASPTRTPPTLAGRPVTLGDLAAAYRAAFHFGDNPAYVSLDAHPDPLLSAVSLGGYLEDTPIGAVVLAADRRFKTLSSGLDPESREDVRGEIRRKIPPFLTMAERSFLDRSAAPTDVWVGTRFWFYPDSVGVETDRENRTAVITRARFTGDAERLGDSSHPPTGKVNRRPPPSAEVAEAVRQLNRNYDQYARAFPELQEMDTVARLMAVAAWLRRVRPDWLDLDALLAVPVPSVATPRELPKLIATSYVAALTGTPLTEERIRADSRSILLNPFLQRTVGDSFADAEEFAEWLALREGKAAGEGKAYREKASRSLDHLRGKRLAEILETGDDVVALVKYMAARLEYPAPPEAMAPAQQLEDDRRRMEAIRGELERLPPGEGERKRALEEEYAAIRGRHHETRFRMPYRIKAVVEITGGVNLWPENFDIRRSPGSPALKRFAEMSAGAVSSGERRPGAAWIRSKGRTRPAAATPAAPRPGPSPAKGAAPPAIPRPPAATKPPASPAGPPPEERVESRKAAPRAVGEIRVTATLPAGPAQVRGRIAPDGRIVFSADR
jgi:hypothetical protein